MRFLFTEFIVATTNHWNPNPITDIDDVTPHGGSFMVWPGSHRKLHAFLTTGWAGQRNGYAKKTEEKKNFSGGPDQHPTWACAEKETHAPYQPQIFTTVIDL